MDIIELTEAINGKIIGSQNYFNKEGFTGIFTFLGDASSGDIVIRHWVNAKGIEIAASKKVSCFITLNPTDDAIKKAIELKFPLIICEKIELATAFALNWSYRNYTPNAKSIIITGTNGKSTTSHLIYHILKNAGFRVFTNTDSESECNTLCDPVVSKMIVDEVTENGSLDYLVIEVSEVQGWFGALMKGHAYLMSNAVVPICGVITNIAMDHIGLVNSIDEVFNEIFQVPNAINEGNIVLNYDDDLVMKLDSNFNNINPFYFSMNNLTSSNNNIIFDNDKQVIVFNKKTILSLEELPFNTNHFIQNILAAIGACISIGIPIDDIKKGIKSYKSLNRRFSKINNQPLIYDDFAHNPDGIKSTILETKKFVPTDGNFYIISSIRGSRGVDINKYNVEAIAKSIDSDTNLIISSSNDVVNNLNFVEDEEREIFFKILNENNIDYIHYNNLKDALKETYDKLNSNDVMLLIGAQGMDPAESILKKIINGD